MQQRFCTCGSTIWVQYLFSNTDCRVVFRPRDEGKYATLTRCPGCGRKLDIDELH